MFQRASEMPGFVALHRFDVPDGRELLEMTRSYTKASSTFQASPADDHAADELASRLRAKSAT
ncbi:hypothetical protein VSH64_11425 [Amycolatopsis rhabdoformis]|uniref:DUF5753 domain-containing protein n=1 Tax=Amycolatopsis rhabdoformis TaxID=1448059 RepID=A0ABZ1IE71_9PSEU|nr:hypothetical protein [Amycolatopsis rhabdoformis]WSE32712.1 hypothetical protein VSH64_11425 [Amycolatopsis rhabdoformis]